MPPPGRRPWHLALLALAGAALAWLTVSVVYVRWLWEPAARLRADADTCFHAFAPDADETLRKGPLVWRLRTDAQGLRVPEEPGPELPVRCDVLAAGDSFTAGLWVRGDEAWPAALEAALRARGLAVRVRNGGVQGHTIAQERLVALRHGAGAKAVIVARTANDLDDLSRLLVAGCRLDETEPGLLRPVAEPPPAWLAPVPVPARVSSRYVLPGERGPAAAERLAAAEPGPARCEAAAAAYERLALDLAARLAAQGGHLVLASLEPLVCEGGGAWDARAFSRRLTEKLRGAGALVVPMEDLAGRPGSTLAPHDSHPSPGGHAAIAARLAAALLQSGRLDGCRAAEAP